MINEWIAILAAGTGAGGAILAQLFGSMFAASREAKRLEWEKSSKQLEWNLQRAERFLDLKREKYSRYLGLTYKIISDTSEKVRNEIRDGEYQVLEFKASDHIEELDDLRWNIQLIASASVSSAVEVVHVQMFSSQILFYRPDKYSQKRRKQAATNALRGWQDMKRLMRSDLDHNPDSAGKREYADIHDSSSRDRSSVESNTEDELRAKIDELREIPIVFPKIDPSSSGGGDKEDPRI